MPGCSCTRPTSFPTTRSRLRTSTSTASRKPHAAGHVTVAWEAMEAWYEEDERVEVHPRDPYHRIDTFATSRVVRVSLAGIVLAESRRARALFEMSL